MYLETDYIPFEFYLMWRFPSISNIFCLDTWFIEFENVYWHFTGDAEFWILVFLVKTHLFFVS